MEAIKSLLLVFFIVILHEANGFMSDVLIQQLRDDSEDLLNRVIRAALYETEGLPFDATADDKTLKDLRAIVEMKKKKADLLHPDSQEQFAFYLATKPKFVDADGKRKSIPFDTSFIWTSKRPFKGRVAQLIEGLHRKWIENGFIEGLSPAMVSSVSLKGPSKTVPALFLTGLLATGLLSEQADQEEIESWWLPFSQSKLFREHLSPAKLSKSKAPVLPMIDRIIEGLLGNKGISEGAAGQLKKMPDGPTAEKLFDSLQEAIFDLDASDADDY